MPGIPVRHPLISLMLKRFQLMHILLIAVVPMYIYPIQFKVAIRRPFRLLDQLHTNVAGADGLALGGFGIDDILSKEDMLYIGESFDRLKLLFPSIEQETIRRIATRSPYLLTLSSEKMILAVNRIRVELPFVDPSYIMSQRTLGVELLVHCTSSTFNIENQVIQLGQILEEKRNVTEFIRRVPHVLSPRLLLNLQVLLVIFMEIKH